MHSVDECRIFISTAQVSARLNGDRGGVSQISGELVSGGHVGDGGTVGDDIAGEMPVSLELLLEQHLARAGRRSIHRVVGAHDAAGSCVDDQFPEGWQVGVFEIVW